jgi:hypothetical protein
MHESPTTVNLKSPGASIPRRKLTSVIVESAAGFFGVTSDDIFNGHRRRPVMLARRAAIVELHSARPHWSYPRLGKEMGGLDHTSIIHALRKAGVYRPNFTRQARAARVIGKWIQRYEAIGDMYEHAACCRLATGFAALQIAWEGGAK